jgi:putative ABC transport system substrate-binding protein
MRRLLSAIAWMLLALMVDVCAAAAQQPGRVYKIGYLWIGRAGLESRPFESWTEPNSAIRDALRDNGFVVGKNLVVDVRHAHGEVARLAVEAESLVASGVDVIVTVGTPPTLAAMQATKRIPIVFMQAGDPVEKGLIASLASPGGNVTGMATLITQPKLWQFLREISPSTRRVAVVGYAQNRGAPEDRVESYRAFVNKRWMEAAAAVGMEYLRMPVNSLGEVDSKFAELAGGGDAGIIISVDSTVSLWRSELMQMALQHRLVSSCPQGRWWAEAGCLVTYTEDVHAMNRGLGTNVAKVLKGTRPADIPVEQPTVIKLIINAKTAKALDLTVPPSLLALADEVIE